MQLGGAPEGADHEISGVFQPNAPSRGELRSLAGLQARQALKGRGQFLGERIRLAVTDRTVTACLLAPFGARLRTIGRWARTDLFAIRVQPFGVTDQRWPALVLLDLTRLELIADLRAFRNGPAEREVLRRLEAAPSVPVARRP